MGKISLCQYNPPHQPNPQGKKELFYSYHNGRYKLLLRIMGVMSVGDLSELINKIHCADSIDFMKSLPDGCIDLVFTSPPYLLGPKRLW